ncbi:MAG: hypothetical protein IPL58_10100 [Betaproteobacteria bacterium]|uniref:Uncharacterized protein n=1 Tax=Candidatus Proximibacter danicus TaxID=2954365 RepID=A0A9D7K4D0_9PROT|nr:hypothetical protein [Candidatus Proximibacter danicus]
MVPQLAVPQGSNGHLVYVVSTDGLAAIRPVLVGDYVGEKDIVVVERPARRRPGRRGGAGQGRARQAGDGGRCAAPRPSAAKAGAPAPAPAGTSTRGAATPGATSPTQARPNEDR